MLLGAFVDQCACGQWYLARCALGVADVHGLTGEQGERYHEAGLNEKRLAELLREIGTIRYRERAS